MRHVEVIADHSDLEREYWRFLYFDDAHQLRLTDWAREVRETKRHKYKAVESFDVYRYRREGKTAPATIPESVQQEACRPEVVEVSHAQISP